MNITGRKSWARVGMSWEPGQVDESGLSGPVVRYTLPPEELERIFQDVKPHEPCPGPNVSKARSHSQKIKSEQQITEEEDIDPNNEIDVEEIERIEAGDTDPAWSFDNCKW